MKYMQKIEYKLVREPIDTDNGKRTIQSPGDVYNWFKFLADSDREKFLVLCLDNSKKIVCFDLISIGSTGICPVSVREVVKAAILTNATGVILVHNHPSGSIKASREDIELTKVLKNACNMFSISLHDHVIICGSEYYSFRENKDIK